MLYVLLILEPHPFKILANFKFRLSVNGGDGPVLLVTRGRERGSARVEDGGGGGGEGGGGGG